MSNSTLHYDTQSCKAEERNTNFGPLFKQFTSEITPAQIQARYAALLKDQVTARFDAIERQKLDEWNLCKKDRDERRAEAERQRQSEIARKREDERLRQIMEEQRRAMQGHQK